LNDHAFINILGLEAMELCTSKNPSCIVDMQTYHTQTTIASNGSLILGKLPFAEGWQDRPELLSDSYRSFLDNTSEAISMSIITC
jgi:hypothetical protein